MLPDLRTRRERVAYLRTNPATLADVVGWWHVSGGQAELMLYAANPATLPAGKRRVSAGIERPALLRRFLSDPAYLGLKLSPLQEALVELADRGRWPTASTVAHVATDDPEQLELDQTTEVRQATIGGGSVRYRARTGAPPGARPDSICIVAGVRGGKTTIAACAIVACALTADLSTLRKGEIAYGVIVAPTLDAADKTFEDLSHLLSSTPLKERIIHTRPPKQTEDDDPVAPLNRRVKIRRDDGRHVVLRVVAASRGGLTSRSRWLVGVVLEEAGYFGSEGAGAAVSAEDQYAAVADRVVDGGQVWMISSPNAPEGLLYETWRRVPEGWAVIHAPTRALNPGYPQDRVDRAMRRDPDRARRELGAEFVDADTALVPAEWIERATVPQRTPHPHARRVAAMDPAHRGNGWTLIVADRVPEGIAIVGAREWRGSKTNPLSSGDTLRDIAGFLAKWGCSNILTDKHHVDSLRDLARPHGLVLHERNTTAHQGMEQAQRIRALLSDRALTLCDVPELARDMRAARRVLTPSGTRLLLPHTADGRHADYWPSVSLAVWELRTAAAPPATAIDDDESDGWEYRRGGVRDRAAPWLA